MHIPSGMTIQRLILFQYWWNYLFYKQIALAICSTLQLHFQVLLISTKRKIKNKNLICKHFNNISIYLYLYIWNVTSSEIKIKFLYIYIPVINHNNNSNNNNNNPYTKMSRFESLRTYGEYTPWTRTHTHKRWRLLSRQSPAWWTVEGLKEQRQSAMTGLGTAV